MNMHSTTGRWRLGFSLSLLTAFLWGMLPFVLKILLDTMDPYTITWYRFFISAVFIFFFVIRTSGFPKKIKLSISVVILFFIAIFGLCANYITYLIGLNYITPSTANVVIQMAPIFMLLGGLFIFKEHFNIKQWIGLIILLFGLLFFFNDRLLALVSHLTSYSMGIFWIVGAAMLWAAYALAQKQLLQIFNSQTIMLFIYLSGALLFLPFANPTQIIRLDSITVILLVFCAFNTIIAYGCFAEALDHLEASRVSAILSTTPIITIIMMFLFSKLFTSYIQPENLNTISILGACLVVCGSMICSLSKSDKN